MKKLGVLLLFAGLLGLASCSHHSSSTSTQSASSIDSMVNQATSEVGGAADTAGQAVKHTADSLAHEVNDRLKK